MSTMKGWLVCTAGLGSIDFNEASFRVARESASLPGVSASLAVTESELHQYAPNVLSKYERYLNEKNPGFGFFTWKAEIVRSAIQGQFGQYRGVVWIDSGCEINRSVFAKLRFKKILKLAEKNGAFTYMLNTLESHYTKNSLLKAYPKIDPGGLQIQATWFVLSGEVGRKIAEEWYSQTMKSINFSNDSVSREGENPNFIAHRHDQSIFSLVCKANGVVPNDYVPVAGTRGIPAQIRALSHPIWNSRNRQGKSIKKTFLRILGV